MGIGRCSSSSECQGNRKCKKSIYTCEGVSGCADAACYINELNSPLGVAHKCRTSVDCKGNRTCSK